MGALDARICQCSMLASILGAILKLANISNQRGIINEFLDHKLISIMQSTRKVMPSSNKYNALSL